MSLMQLKAIEVSQFRQFSDTQRIEGLDEGLNIIAGSNEAGKSTLLTAIRAALFDRYRSSVGDTFKPYNAAVSPKVCLEFTVDGVEYILEKTFSSRRDGGVSLKDSDGRSWEGPEAEDFLAELLGFAYSGRGASKPEHQGLAGLLWVEQAKAYEVVELRDDSRQRVQSVFEDEMRELLGGDQGDQLHQQIESLRSEYFGSSDNPVGDYRRLLNQESELAETLESKRDELSEYEGKVDRLESLQRRLDEYKADDTLERLEQSLHEAEQNLESLSVLQQTIESGEQQVSAAEARLETATQSLETRETLKSDLTDTMAEVERLESFIEQKVEEASPLNIQIDQYQSEIDQLKEDRKAVIDDLRRARSCDQLEQLNEKIKVLDSTIKAAQLAREERLRCENERNGIDIDQEGLDEIKGLEAEISRKKARLEAVATRLDFNLLAEVNVEIDGQPLTGSGSIRLTEKANMAVKGAGEFIVTPGGEDLDSLSREIREAEEHFEQKLQDVGADCLVSAEELVRRKDDLEREINRHASDYERLAPEGLETIEDERDSLVARKDKILEEAGGDDASALDTASLELKERELTERIEEIEDSLSAEKITHQAVNDALVEARGSLAPQSERLARLTHQLEQARELHSDKTLDSAVTEASDIHKNLLENLQTSKQSLDEKNPDAVNAEVERLQTAYENISKEIDELNTDIRDAKIELTALGHRGLSEEVAQAADDHALIAAQLNAMRRRAEALDLLHRVLSAALSRAKHAVAQPVIEKISPYLRQLIEGAEPVINEELSLVGIRRSGTDEDFEQLSIGTREQLSVIIRLAYADLLSEAGVPVTLILDDALVNSDDDRRDRMKGILYQAAKNYQVIVLTCHGREYADAGGLVHRLHPS